MKKHIVKSKGAPAGNRNAIGNKGGGRNSGYKKEFDEQVYRICLLGLTDREIASFFDISESTLNEWKKNHLSFSESLRMGKTIADANVAHSLYRRAVGYTYQETSYESIATDQKQDIVKDSFKKKVVLKELPGDVGAAKLWLLNRTKELWRDRQTLDIDWDTLTDDQLDRIVERLKKYSNGKN